MSEVLIVEDDPVVAKVVRQMLESRKHTVNVAKSAAEAAEFLSSHVVRAIISDGLAGDWTKVIQEGTLKGIDLLIVMSSSDLSEAVLPYSGVKFFPKQEAVESMKTILSLLSQK